MSDQNEYYRPSADFVRDAPARDQADLIRRAAQDIQGFWAEQAKHYHWYQRWDQVLDESERPFFRWFVGGRTNIVANCLDRHMKTWRKNKLALIWESEQGEQRTFSYHALNREVCMFANVLRSMGVQQGDRITLYMGRVPELVIAMLACAKIGAVHSVVYGGFSVQALHGRIEDSRSKLVITCDGGTMNGKRIELKRIVDEALARCASVETVIVYRRTGHEVAMEQGRDYWWHDLMGLPTARNPNGQKGETAELDAEHPLFLLYTSGTTGQPKAILHTHGGYMVGIGTTLDWVFNVREEDRWWCTADPGWVTGHSYVVYGPLLLGLTSVMYEGAPTYPFPNRWWSLIEKHGITHLYTAPTAIRGLMRFGEAWPNRHDLSSLRILGSVGEPINPEAWRWYHRVIGAGRCPIMDTWWQTETGMFAITPLPTTPLKPGSATLPFPGIDADVVNENGEPTQPGEEGYLVLRSPWPAMFRTIYNDPDRYVDQYWKRFPGLYFAGDSARKDDNGYFWIIGRVDDVIKVSGYRLGTAEIESALVSHAAVAEAAAIGLPHDVRGNSIHAYVLLRAGHEGSDALGEELKRHVAHELGPIGKPERINFVSSLPKTRSGKIMRRVLKARALGISEGDLSTLEE